MTVGIAATLFFDVALAKASETGVTFRFDGKQVTLTVSGATRREVLQKLLVERGIQVDWRNEDMAQDAVEGGFQGEMAYVVRRLLAPADSIIVYDTGGDEPRISRVIVIGPSRGGSARQGIH